MLEKETREFWQLFHLDITLSAHSTWDNAVLCHVSLLPNEFYVSRHTARVPDRTVQWERTCFACVVCGLDPSGMESMGGCGKEKTLILWHHMARKEGWREVDGYACTAAPVCSAHVWEVCGMCTPVCAGTLAHVYECDACMTYIQMYVQVYEQCMWKSEEDVLNLALALSAMLFWDRVSTKSGARLVARKPQWSSCFFPWRCWGYRCVWLWCAENLNAGCRVPAAGALIHRIISLAVLFVWAVSFTKLQFTDWLGLPVNPLPDSVLPRYTDAWFTNVCLHAGLSHGCWGSELMSSSLCSNHLAG